jgi:predicted metalloprotease with PDZ domain
MKYISIFYLTLLFSAQIWAQSLHYTITPIWSDKERALEVTLTFRGDSSGQTQLFYAENQFGEPGQFEYIQINQAGQDASILADSNAILVRHAPNAEVVFTYRVRDKWPLDTPLNKYCCFTPIMKMDYFHVQSGHLLVFPIDFWPDEEARCHVQIEWRKLPSDWLVHSSFGADATQGGYLTQSELGYGVFVGGDFRRHTFQVRQSPVHFLTRSQWRNVSEDTIKSILERTVEGHRAFWEDFSDTIYTVTFLPIDDAPWTATNKSTSVGGSVLCNSFMSYATNHAGLVMEPLRYVFVHELMHRWIGTEIENAQEEQQYWFSEGFTDYFTYKSMLRYQMISADDWLKELNSQVVRPHYMAPVRSQANSALTYEKFWNGGRDWEKLPYRRGCLYAFYLDNLIRKKSDGAKNLDMVMRDLLGAVRKDKSLKLDAALFLRTLEPYVGAKRAKKDYERYIERGEPIEFSARSLPKGMSVRKQSGTLSSGAGPNHVSKVVAYKNVPFLYRKKKTGADELKAAIAQ